MIVEKYQDGFFFAMASILLDLLQQFKKKKDLSSSHLLCIWPDKSPGALIFLCIMHFSNRENKK